MTGKSWWLFNDHLNFRKRIVKCGFYAYDAQVHVSYYKNDNLCLIISHFVGDEYFKMYNKNNELIFKDNIDCVELIKYLRKYKINTFLENEF